MRGKGPSPTLADLAWIVALLLTLSAPADLRAATLQVEVELEPPVIQLEELATLSIEIRGRGSAELQDTPFFALENLTVVSGPHLHRSFRSLSGGASRSFRWVYKLRPHALGPARVHSISVEIGRQLIELPDRQIQVVSDLPPALPREGEAWDPLDNPLAPFFRDRQPTLRPPRGNELEVFLRAEIGPTRVYVGQQLLYTVYLYTQNRIQSIDPPRGLPDFHGFWVREIPHQDQEVERVEDRDEPYWRVIILQRALFPLRAGRFELKPTAANLVVQLARRRGSFVARSKEIVRQSNPVTVDVLSPPSPPEDFHGAVGRLSLEASLEPPVVAVGEAATLEISLSGEGHLQALPDPALPQLRGLEILPPRRQLAGETVAGSRLETQRSWTYAVVPRRAGTWELPPIRIPYFDPRQGRYRKAESPTLVLQATPRTGAGVEELHPIRSAALPPPPGNRWGRAGPWLFAVPWLTAGLLLAVRRQGRFWVTNEPSRATLNERLRRAAAESEARKAATAIEDTWRDYLVEHWDVPPGSPSSQWPDLLTQQGVCPKARRHLVELADQIHGLRHAPKLSSTEVLQRALVATSRHLLRLLPAFVALLVTATSEAGELSREALVEGNRLFRNGQIEEAIAVYSEGLEAARGDPTLLYNLGTGAHHVGQLPEAILWYRRAALESPTDPWLQENLDLARKALDAQPIRPRGAAGWILTRAGSLSIAGTILAWAALVLTLLPLELRRNLPAAFLALALALYGAGVALKMRGPQAAVLLADCTGREAWLPAGSEVWVASASEDRWRILGGPTDLTCAADSVVLVESTPR